MPSLRFLAAALRRVLLALPFLLALAPPATAAAADAFAVKVDVDVSAGTVAIAKENAIAEAQRTGFRRLLERLTPTADHGRLPQADALQYVRDFAVDQERSSTVRYIATLTVRYNPAAVRRLLRDHGIHYADARTRPVVVMPVFKGKDGVLALWSDPNPWRAAWAAAGPGGLVPVTVPASDTATPEQALAGERSGPDTLVAAAALAPVGNQLDVSLTGGPGVPKPFDVKSYEVAEGALDAALRFAVHDILQGMEMAYKQQNTLQFDRAGSLATMVPLAGFEDWLAVRERLARVTQVRRYELVSLSRAEAALVLHTVGDPEQVKTALATAGLSLDWSEGYWTMRASGTRR